MEYVNITFRLLAISQTLLFLLFVAFSDNPLRVKSVGMAFIIGVMAYIAIPLIEDYTPHIERVKVFWLIANIVPSLLLLFVFFIFEESCEIPKWLIALVSLSVLSSVWFQFSIGNHFNLPIWLQTPKTDVTLTVVCSPLWLQILKAGITLTAICIIWNGRESDLVELRTKLRTIFVLVVAVQTLMVIFLEMMTHFDPPLILDTVMQFLILIFCVAVNYFFIKLNPQGTLMATVAPVTMANTEKVVDPHIAELLDRMRSERLYADHDLRVNSLAQMINLPEYKLRKKINQELGYRNFNHFVNHYRIEEAGIKLREDTRIPVLTIALDVGFRSISSFNSAFQAHFGLSPTKYRAESLPNI